MLNCFNYFKCIFYSITDKWKLWKKCILIYNSVREQKYCFDLYFDKVNFLMGKWHTLIHLKSRIYLPRIPMQTLNSKWVFLKTYNNYELYNELPCDVGSNIHRKNIRMKTNIITN